MGKVVAVLRVMPESVEADLEELKASMRKKVPGIQDIREEPIAFGLKALKLAVVVGDEEGGTDAVEQSLRSVSGVASAETIEVNRMI
ncbi:MAG: elongation factor 1-beta [Methanomicrobiales archaeon]|nr:elongation factor 1-beta [Methanomicrobiales archaeon]MDI6875990.1 elongation factor 1-beta [Methanomicrobiales archaeon]